MKFEKFLNYFRWKFVFCFKNFFGLYLRSSLVYDHVFVSFKSFVRNRFLSFLQTSRMFWKLWNLFEDEICLHWLHGDLYRTPERKFLIFPEYVYRNKGWHNLHKLQSLLSTPKNKSHTKMLNRRRPKIEP